MRTTAAVAAGRHGSACSDGQIGEERLRTDVNKKPDAASGFPSLCFSKIQNLDAIHAGTQSSVLHVDAQVDPFVRADIGPRLVATVRILLAKAFEVPLRVGEILHGPLSTGSRRIYLGTVEGPDIDSFEALQVLRDSVGKTRERPSIRA
jgi:hypothetical protein